MDPRPGLRGATALVLGLSLVLGPGACSRRATSAADPEALLTRAKAKIDSSSSARFTLTSSNVSTKGTSIVGGQGDLARPDQIQGSFRVSLDGFTADVKVVSKGGVFEALLPFQAHYEVTDPAKYGLSDPSTFLDPKTGLTRLLSVAEAPHLTGSERIAGELVDTVAFTVPGADIPVLPDLEPSQRVDGVAAIDPKTDELRQIQLTGPFTSAKSDSTYTLTLTNYNEQVNITLPSTS